MLIVLLGFQSMWQPMYTFMNVNILARGLLLGGGSAWNMGMLGLTLQFIKNNIDIMVLSSNPASLAVWLNV